MFSAPASHEHRAFLSHENNSILRIQFPIEFEISRPFGQEAAVVPMQLNGWHTSTRRELVMDHCSDWNGFREDRCRAGLNTLRWAKFERRENRRQVMDPHIAKATGAEIPPTAPAKRCISRIVRTHWRGAEPEIPIERRRHGRGIFGPLDALSPPKRRLAPVGGAVGPYMYFMHRADGAVPKPFVNEAVALERHSLIPHLRRHFGFAG